MDTLSLHVGFDVLLLPSGSGVLFHWDLDGVYALELESGLVFAGDQVELLSSSGNRLNHHVVSRDGRSRCLLHASSDLISFAELVDNHWGDDRRVGLLFGGLLQLVLVYRDHVHRGGMGLVSHHLQRLHGKILQYIDLGMLGWHDVDRFASCCHMELVSCMELDMSYLGVSYPSGVMCMHRSPGWLHAFRVNLSGLEYHSARLLSLLDGSGAGFSDLVSERGMVRLQSDLGQLCGLLSGMVTRD